MTVLVGRMAQFKDKCVLVIVAAVGFLVFSVQNYVCLGLEGCFTFICCAEKLLSYLVFTLNLTLTSITTDLLKSN